MNLTQAQTKAIKNYMNNHALHYDTATELAEATCEALGLEKFLVDGSVVWDLADYYIDNADGRVCEETETETNGRKHFNGKNAETGKNVKPLTVNEETKMARKSNGKTQTVVETPTVETPTVETPTVETPKTEETVVETPTVETPTVATNAQEWVNNYGAPTTHNDTEVSSIQWSCIKGTLDDLEVNGLKEVIEYCSTRIDVLQKEEVESLEAQMRAIQDKLMALKGHKKYEPKAYKAKESNGDESEAKRVATPLVNPANPNEVYTFGRTPDWVVALCAKTGKTVRELKDEVKAASV